VERPAVRETIAEESGFEEIAGRSPALRKALSLTQRLVVRACTGPRELHAERAPRSSHQGGTGMDGRTRALLRRVVTGVAAVIALAVCGPARAADQPNIVIIWGDDIGQTNVSAYSMGLMGFHTPNIDRVAKEGISGCRRKTRRSPSC
jgi:hypothetical protein